MVDVGFVLAAGDKIAAGVDAAASCRLRTLRCRAPLPLTVRHGRTRELRQFFDASKEADRAVVRQFGAQRPDAPPLSEAVTASRNFGFQSASSWSRKMRQGLLHSTACRYSRSVMECPCGLSLVGTTP